MKLTFIPVVICPERPGEEIEITGVRGNIEKVQPIRHL